MKKIIKYYLCGVKLSIIGGIIFGTYNGTVDGFYESRLLNARKTSTIFKSIMVSNLIITPTFLMGYHLMLMSPFYISYKLYKNKY